MVLPQVKYVTAERHDFRSVLRENRAVKIEVSQWSNGGISRRKGMVLPHATRLAAERDDIRSVLREN
jgi:hypothetical protein